MALRDTLGNISGLQGQDVGAIDQPFEAGHVAFSQVQPAEALTSFFHVHVNLYPFFLFGSK